MNNTMTKIVILLLTLYVVDANSIGISSTVEFANESGDAIFTVSNNDGIRQYINVVVSEVRVENGQLTFTPYNRDNVADWELDVTPARAIIDINVQKDFKASFRPKVKGDELKERVFKLDILPTPYFAPGEKVNGAVKFAFGVSPYVIIPAKANSPIEYSVIYKGDKVHISNIGSNYFTAKIDTCLEGTSSKLRNTCSLSAHLLSGRVLIVDLPESMQHKDAINVSFSSFDNEIKHYSTFVNKGV